MPAANAGSSRCARPRGVAAAGWAATACPVGFWCGAPTSRPRPGRTSSRRRRGDQGTERGSGGGTGDGGREGGRPSRREQGRQGGTQKWRRRNTPRDDGTSRGHQCNRVQRKQQGGGETQTRRGNQWRGRVRAATCPGTSRPCRTYVSGRSTGNRFTGTRARISTAALLMTRCGKRGDVTLRSCH